MLLEECREFLRQLLASCTKDCMNCIYYQHRDVDVSLFGSLTGLARIEQQLVQDVDRFGRILRQHTYELDRSTPSSGPDTLLDTVRTDDFDYYVNTLAIGDHQDFRCPFWVLPVVDQMFGSQLFRDGQLLV